MVAQARGNPQESNHRLNVIPVCVKVAHLLALELVRGDTLLAAIL